VSRLILNALKLAWAAGKVESLAESKAAKEHGGKAGGGELSYWDGYRRTSAPDSGRYAGIA
jgi:hypothetical protein